MLRVLLAASRPLRLHPAPTSSYRLRAFHQSKAFQTPAEAVAPSIAQPATTEASPVPSAETSPEPSPQPSTEASSDQLVIKPKGPPPGKNKRGRLRKYKPTEVATNGEYPPPKEKRKRKCKNEEVPIPPFPEAVTSYHQTLFGPPKFPSFAEPLTRQRVKLDGRLKSKRGAETWPSGPAKAVQRLRKLGPEDPLKDPIGYLKVSKSSGWPPWDKKRMDITSEQLCDDVLERLKPSLQKHMGCDIIDLNPGIGIWSKKLHSALKPRTHILMEPDNNTLYAPFLQPLVEAPDSNYKLVPNSGLVWDHLESVLTPENLPHQPQLQVGDPRLDQPNDTLLFVANIGFYPNKPYREFDSLPTLVLYQFVSAIRSQSLFQRYGQVRMLIWMYDNDGKGFLPHTISQRKKASLETELTCESVEEVASLTITKSHGPRNPKIDIAVGQRVLKRMEELGIQTPPGRESVLMEELKRLSEMPEVETDPGSREPIPDPELPGGGLTGMRRKRLELTPETRQAKMDRNQAMKELIAVFGEESAPFFKKWQQFHRDKNNENPPTKMQRRAWEKNTEIKFMSLFHSLREKVEDLISIAQSPAFDTPEGKKEWDEKFAAFSEKFKNVPSYSHSRELSMQLDNARAAALDPPVLLYDRRRFEPLRVRPSEFLPEQGMKLLDFVPRRTPDILRKSVNYDLLEFITGNLMNNPSQSMKKALLALYPGAYEYLKEHCESLSDPKRGGCPDHDILNVRLVTQEMLLEMLEKWDEWPFKPNRYELVHRMGDGFGPPAHDPDMK